MFYEWHKASIFFFYCLNLVTVLKISTREKLTSIWPIAQGEIIATMFEAARIYFLSHAFAAVVVVDALKATVPNNISWRLLRTLKVGCSVEKEVPRRKMRRKNAN